MWQHKTDYKDMKFKSIMIAAASKNFLSTFVIPSLDDLVAMIKSSGKHTLKEIRISTNEKLSIKIFRQFCFEISCLLPIMLLITLQLNLAILDQCSFELVSWLYVWTGVMLFTSLVRLGRIPVLLHFRSPKPYFIYSTVTFFTNILAVAVVFVWGNILFWTLIRAPQCQVASTAMYDPKILWFLMGLILLLHWLVIMIIAQIVFFCIMIYLLYVQIIKSIDNLKNDFSTRNLVKEVFNAIGEGEMQDNITLGLLMFVL